MRKQFLLGLISLPFLVTAQINTASIENSAKEVNDSVIAWRRHLHQTLNYLIENLKQ
jgi:hypothetical protein